MTREPASPEPASFQPAAFQPAAFELGRIPRIAFGPGTFARVPDVVARHGRRVVLVTGGRSLAASGRLDELVAGLGASGVEVVGHVTVTGEPSPAAVDGAVETHRGAAVDVVLGVGGGSVLDAGKAIAGLLRTGTSVRDHLEGIGPGLPYPGPSVPFVAVPTTAGTGSEATRNAVISELPAPDGTGGFKRSFRDERLVAADAIVDPDLLDGAGPGQIAVNGLDALTQLLESFVSLRAGPVTDALARSGLAAVRDGLVAWHADPNGPDAPAARTRMAYAALLSGICLAHTGLGAVHGLAAALGGAFPVPHGAACGATLVAVTEANVDALERRSPASPALVRYAELGRLLAPPAAPLDDAAARAALVSTLRDWVAALDAPGLGRWGVSVDAIPGLVAASRGSSMRTNPVVLEDGELGRAVRASL